ncbi:NAD(P)/FAD-dependent oxidoreductase [Rhizobium sp. XQZ8]|nr:NAD(P)/FAD-dependent oxidoreductase [Rhizobium populisoli]
MGLKRRDCVIIGGGPAGLTAAIYLSRYHLSVIVFDDGTSRAATIPISHNHAGFPDGIGGSELLERMRAQALTYGAEIVNEHVNALSQRGDEFLVSFGNHTLPARTVMIATGVINRPPAMPKGEHDEALRRGLIRYCPVCDGFEVTDKQVAVVGQGAKAFDEAVFLRSYTREVKLFLPGEHDLQPHQQARLTELGIHFESGPLKFEVEQEAILIRAGAAEYRFDSIYPALGSDVRSELVTCVGATLSNEGCIRVDDHQRTNVPGLYAAGDVVIGLDQISHAMGQAGVAATTIRNDLSERSPLVR